MVVSTTERKSGERSTSSRRRSPADQTSEGRSPASEDDIARTQRALRIAFGSVLPRIRGRREIYGRGIGTTNFASLCVRDQDFFLSLARDVVDAEWSGVREDMRLSILSELRTPQLDDAVRRVERQHLEEAALEIELAVGELPGPLCAVVRYRAMGLSFRKIAGIMKGRAPFSLVDDWNRAISLIWERHELLVRRIV